MSTNRFTLNERQLALLRRIVTGDAPVTSSEPGTATTVYALRNRGLVEARRRHGSWTATPTDAGRFFVEHGWHPKDPRRHPEQTKPVRPHPGPTEVRAEGPTSATKIPQ